MTLFRIHLSTTSPKASVAKKLDAAFPNMTTSIEKVVRPTSRADRLAEAQSMIADAKGIVEELKDEMNMPENLQQGDKAQEVEAARDALEEIMNDLDTCEGASVDFPGMR